MKPEQFIREFGVEKAREVIAKDQFVADLCLITPSGKLIYYKKVKGSFPEVTDFGKIELDADDYFMLELSDLKRLVESLDLVNCFDDLEQAKSWVSDMDEDFPYVFKGDTYDNRFYKHELVTAIADHESIYGGGENA